jgi:hypothetical protein
MERSGIRESSGFRPDGLHPGYRVFVQFLRGCQKTGGIKNRTLIGAVFYFAVSLDCIGYLAYAAGATQFSTHIPG